MLTKRPVLRFTVGLFFLLKLFSFHILYSEVIILLFSHFEGRLLISFGGYFHDFLTGNNPCTFDVFNHNISLRKITHRSLLL